MQSCDLQEMLERLDSARELFRIKVQVDSRHELALISRRAAALPHGGPALLFENVDGSPVPVLTNLFGSTGRIARLLGISDINDLALLMSQFIAHGGPPPLHVAPPLCRETAAEFPSCDALPVPVVWPEDGRPEHGGRFITLGQVVTREYGGTAQNLGIYRAACFSGSEIGINWRPGSGGALHHASWRGAGREMPVAIALGGDPAVAIAAMTPLPPETDELVLAGFLRGAGVPVCRALTSDLVIPAQAEIIIEGLVDPEVTRNEGSFGNYTGEYAGGGYLPLMRVTAVTSRRSPVLPALIPGPPPCENLHLAAAVARLTEPLAGVSMNGAQPWPTLFKRPAGSAEPYTKLAWSPETEELVDRRWREYGFSDGK